MTAADSTPTTPTGLTPTQGPLWPEILSKIIAGRDLSESQARAAMSALLSGDTSPAVTGAFLSAMRAKGESISEMAAFASVMWEFGRRVSVPGTIIDTCGTGGDRSSSINVSTTAAFIVAGAGGVVCKHGGRAASSMSGSADVLEALGVRVELGERGVEECLLNARIGFCYAPTYHPAMANVVGVRRELKVPTMFNFLGPLVNPARASRQIVGVADPEMAEVLIGVLGRIGSTRAMVVWGEDGLDELTTTSVSKVIELERDESGSQEIRRYDIDGRDLGFRRSTLSELRGGGAQTNAQILRETLEGATGPRTDIAVLNAAGGIYIGGLAETLVDAVELAWQALASGAALETLEMLIKISRSFDVPQIVE